MTTLLEAMMEAEYCSEKLAIEILFELGFEESQLGIEVKTETLDDGTTYIDCNNDNSWGYICAGGSGDPMYSESLQDLTSFDPAIYTEAAIKLGLYMPYGYELSDRPWNIMAAQYDTITHTTNDCSPKMWFDSNEYNALKIWIDSNEYGQYDETGMALLFDDGSIYFQGEDDRECWDSVDEFKRDNPGLWIWD